MRQNFASRILGLAWSAMHVAAAGTPVLAPRASTTVTPITVTGNGLGSNHKQLS
jgi:hypothetical protein